MFHNSPKASLFGVLLLATISQFSDLGITVYWRIKAGEFNINVMKNVHVLRHFANGFTSPWKRDPLLSTHQVTMYIMCIGHVPSLERLKSCPFGYDLCWQVLRASSKTHIPSLASAIEAKGPKRPEESLVCRSEHAIYTVSYPKHFA